MISRWTELTVLLSRGHLHRVVQLVQHHHPLRRFLLHFTQAQNVNMQPALRIRQLISTPKLTKENKLIYKNTLRFIITRTPSNSVFPVTFTIRGIFCYGIYEAFLRQTWFGDYLILTKCTAYRRDTHHIPWILALPIVSCASVSRGIRAFKPQVNPPTFSWCRLIPGIPERSSINCRYFFRWLFFSRWNLATAFCEVYIRRSCVTDLSLVSTSAETIWVLHDLSEVQTKLWLNFYRYYEISGLRTRRGCKNLPHYNLSRTLAQRARAFGNSTLSLRPLATKEDDLPPAILAAGLRQTYRSKTRSLRRSRISNSSTIAFAAQVSWGENRFELRFRCSNAWDLSNEAS